MLPNGSFLSLFFLYIVTGLTVGVSHCVGMCGPINLAIAMGRRDRSVFLPLALYHAGRITTYMILGGLMGFAGSFTGVAEVLPGMQHAVLTAAGILLISMGLSMAGIIPGIGRLNEITAGGGWVMGRIKKWMWSTSAYTYFPIGLLLGLLPCGPVYVALTAAASTGMAAGGTLKGMLSGIGIMAGFGSGTVPALFLLGKLSALRVPANRATLYRIAGIPVVISGVYFLFRGIS